MKFRVGMAVKVLTAIYHANETGEIQEISASRLVVRFPSGVGFYDFASNQFEILE